MGMKWRQRVALCDLTQIFGLLQAIKLQYRSPRTVMAYLCKVLPGKFDPSPRLT